MLHFVNYFYILNQIIHFFLALCEMELASQQVSVPVREALPVEIALPGK
jgi:hypothetical protein